jgi:hypothetical protein
MENKHELYETVCLSGGVAVILFAMVHMVLLPTFRLYEHSPQFGDISVGIPRTYLLHGMFSSVDSNYTGQDIAIGR